MTSTRSTRAAVWHVAAAVVGLGSACRLAADEASNEASPAPQSIAELAPAAIPDDENVAAQLALLAPLLTSWRIDYTLFSNSPLGMGYHAREERGEPPTADQLVAIQKLLDKHAALDAALQRAAACDDYVSRLDVTRLAEADAGDIINAFRPVGQFYSSRIKLLTLAGQHDEAVRRGVEALKLTRLHQREPTLVAALTTLGVRRPVIDDIYDALASGPVSLGTHAALEGELAQLDSVAHLRHVLQTERVYALARERAGGRPADELGVRQGVSGYVQALIEASEQPWRTFSQEAGEGGQFDAPTGFGAETDNLAGGIVAMVRTFGLDMAKVRALRAINALAIFAAANGREATGLAEAGLPEGALADPFGTGPLVVMHTDAGWLVYSVGENGVDDGGAIEGLLDIGFGPRAARVEAEDAEAASAGE